MYQVSILIMLDSALEDTNGVFARYFRAVSILIMLDSALEVCSKIANFHAKASFNPNYAG